MKKFNEWIEIRKDLTENNVSTAARHNGRFLAQIMGWDSHKEPGSWGSTITNWFRGKHQKAQSMSSDIYSIIETPANISTIIAQAQKDGVYQNSTFAACYGIISRLATEFNTGKPKISTTPDFQVALLYEILGKCQSDVALDYGHAHDFYHSVMGTEPAAEQTLFAAYNKDPQNLSEWIKLADTTHKPHPQFSSTDQTELYWRILNQNLISPLNLIEKLVKIAPNHTLAMPANKQEIYGLSVKFAEAYFPHAVNSHRGPSQSNGQNSSNNGLGNKLQDLIDALNHFGAQNNRNVSDVDKSQGDNSAKTGKKQELIAALSHIIGANATASINPDQGSLLATLQDHHSFFGMQQLIENKKLG